MIRRPLKAIELKKEDIRQELQELEQRVLRTPATDIKGEESAKKASAVATPGTPAELRSPGADTIEIRQRIGYQTPAQTSTPADGLFYTPR